MDKFLYTYYIYYIIVNRSAPYFSRSLSLKQCNPREMAASAASAASAGHENVWLHVHLNPLMLSLRSYTNVKMVAVGECRPIRNIVYFGRVLDHLSAMDPALSPHAGTAPDGSVSNDTTYWFASFNFSSSGIFIDLELTHGLFRRGCDSTLKYSRICCLPFLR